MSLIYHLLPAAEYQALPAGGDYAPASLSAEGFIHCTAELDVLLLVANNFYRQTPGDFVVLAIEPQACRAPVRLEPPAPPPPPGSPLAGVLFPHIYGPLNLDAVRDVRPAQRDPGGRFLAFSSILP